jgi:hypothetical protein
MNQVTTGQADATFTLQSGSNPIPDSASARFDLSGSAKGESSWQSLGTPIAQYIGSTGTVDSTGYFAAWSINPSGTGLIGGPSGTPQPSAEITGQIKVEYRYTYDLIPSTETPGPLPLLGAGAAFGFSRRLRKRISATV